MKITTLLACIFLLLIAATASAQTALKWNETGLTWGAPTTCAEGSPLTDCPIAGYRLEIASSCTATTWDLLSANVGNVLSYKATGLAAGPHCYRGKTISTSGQLSAAGPVNAASLKVNTPPAPGAPGAVTASDTFAFQLSSGPDGVLSATNIGRLPAGSLCSSEVVDVSGVTYHRVDFGRVDLTATLQQLPIAAWAVCG